ncbi:taperin [Gadus macrocephalus]|uniref:taperin n=1 Tax=Gadus macrocephalus TaxID=80720 RepID=UPI0028CB70A0|nr:taperin [Gadus macrocephalus]
MSGGDVRVLRQEAGQESPRMPAWKREILERRKAKGSGSGGAGAVSEVCPSGSSQRVNGSEVTGNESGLKTDNGTSATGSSRGFTISTANQHFGGKRGTLASPDLSPLKTNKDPWVSAGDLHDTSETTEKECVGPESLVLHDSLGPLQENPFIKLEKERKRQQDRVNSARPVQHILELYGSVPGIRTIRADNIIIIESDPDYYQEAGSKLQQNGVSSYSSLNDLLDRRGSGVTEIRAREVVIYDTTLSKSEENLSTLGRNDYDYSPYDTEEGHGRVSRMLQKFDSNYGKLHKKSQSIDDLLGLDSIPGSQHRARPKPQPHLVPKPYAVHPQPGSPVRNLGKTHSLAAFQTGGHQSSRSKPSPTATDALKDEVPSGPPPSEPTPTGPPPSVSSYRQHFEDGGADVNQRDETNGGLQSPRPARQRDRESSGESSPKPKVPRSPDPRRAAGAESPTGAASPRVQRSPGFEIRPTAKPDLSLIPEGDSTARALANLRLQSRNTFTVIPKRHGAPPPASSPAASFPKHPPTQWAEEEPRVPTAPAPVTPPARQTDEDEDEELLMGRPSPSPTNTTTDVPKSPSPARLLTTSPSPPPAVSPPPSPVPSVSPPGLSPVPSDPDPAGEFLPVTNIDDIEVERPPAPSPMMQKTKGNTFRVVPKRKAESTTTTTDSPDHPPDPTSSSSPASGGVRPGPAAPATPPAPYSQLGTLLKKRYPAADEIEVVGGYLSLGKSCLAKTGSAGKKISFNESSLQSTYEYPSESTAWDSDGEDEEEGGVGPEVADDQPSMVGRIHIPRPSFTGPAGHSTNSNDLSNYIPKHSVDYNTWQEHKMDDPAHLREANAQQTGISEEVMLTPADTSSLSDYSSEPALYF